MVDMTDHAPLALSQIQRTTHGRRCRPYTQRAARLIWVSKRQGRRSEKHQNLGEPFENSHILMKKLIDAKLEKLQDYYRLQYREADWTVNRIARADKRAYIDDLAIQAENAARRGEQGKVYKITKMVCGKYHGTSDTPIKDSQGRLLTTKKKQEVCWAEHFKEILNRQPPTTKADIQAAETDLDVNTDPPCKQEIVAVKAPGQDNLNA